MTPLAPAIDTKSIEAFVTAIGKRAWRERIAVLHAAGAERTHAGRQVLQRNCIELALERLRARPAVRPPTTAERCIAGYAVDTVRALNKLSSPGQEALLARMRAGIGADGTLVDVFHLLRTAAVHATRGFEVQFAGLEEAAPFDLLITRGGMEAEVACDLISAEAGRGVHRAAWFNLVDRIDPALQTWLRAHPGRYLLKMTLPQGLKPGADDTLIGQLHTRITQMLSDQRRSDGDEAAVLRLDPLMLAAAQADELGLMPRLRREFGPEAHLSVTTAGNGIFVMAARAGQENEVALAIRRRLSALAPTRLTGTRPGILALFVEDTDRAEWRSLRDKLELEGEARQFMTNPEARSVVAVTCTSRLELFGMAEPDAAPGGEMRFRNPAHPAAKTEALAPAILSSF
ncbi:MAG: hypothetical protein ACRYGM_00205 [Janthinobacterium lividum]